MQNLDSSQEVYRFSASRFTVLVCKYSSTTFVIDDTTFESSRCNRFFNTEKETSYDTLYRSVFEHGMKQSKIEIHKNPRNTKTVTHDACDGKYPFPGILRHEDRGF